jgi:ribonuclease P protein component
VTDPIPYRFQKHQRLHLQADFDRVFKDGEVVSDGTLVIHGIRNQLEHSRLGISMSRRVGSAPMRNQWKRWIRESFRLHQYELPKQLDVIIRPRRGAVGTFQAIEASMLRLLPKLEKRLPGRKLDTRSQEPDT